MPPGRIPPSLEQAESTRLRLTFLALLVISLFALLLARLWFLQVMAGERYTALAQGNAVRTVAHEAPRGKILDRDGDPLADNRDALVVAVQPSEMGDRKDAVLADLADLLGMDLAEMRAAAEDTRLGPYRPRPVMVDVPEEIVFYIHENRSTRYPGVYADRVALREYPAGSTAAHIVGYTGEIGPDELADERFAGYRPGDTIGWSGIERSQESVLRGQEGLRRFEVNAQGEIVRVLEDRFPVPGGDVTLTIDLDVQNMVERALFLGIDRARRVEDKEEGPGRGGTFRAPAGAAVVLDPRTSEVLAMASYPTFEPQEFVGGVSHRYWRWLQDTDNAFPLINRAIQSSYPPGSVFKVVSAGAALTEGFIQPGQSLPCPGRWEWEGQVFRNWTRRDAGLMDLASALEYSCDTFFYELARRTWEQERLELTANDEARQRLSEHATAWGFGVPTGIDLPGERAGVIPGRSWKSDFWRRQSDTYCTNARTAEEGSYANRLFSDLCKNGYRWRGGDEVNMSIGQGDVQATPLQVANAFAAIANGGTLYRPHVVRQVTQDDGTVTAAQPEVIGRLPITPEHLAYVQQGLRRVAATGTARSIFGRFPVAVAGKTGTAEMRPKQPFAWFAAYAPFDAPAYVVAVMVEEGGGGSQIAAPIARRILEGLFELEETDLDVGAVTD